MSLGDAAGLVVLAFVVAALGSIVWSTLRLGISPMPTSSAVRRVVLDMLPHAVAGDVHELGAGWGGLALALADRYPTARVVAWEASWAPFLVLKLRLALSPRRNLVALRRDFFGAADLSGAGLVVCYLWTGAMTRLAEKFTAELKPGALVVSHTFALRGWEAEETRHAADVYRTPVYRYRVGPGASGRRP
ncbi:MAG: SAM-dependent methyltransferase [Myxococcota bacterium]